MRKILNRREILKYCGIIGGVALDPIPLRPSIWADHPDVLTLTISSLGPGRRVPADFSGLSYEAAQLTDSKYFTPANRALVGLVRRLSKSGVLRIGGNTSDLTVWMQKSDTPAVYPKRNGAHIPITRESIENLAGFLDATGWSLIYGLNLGTGTPIEAATEAEFVARTVGRRLLAFQIGNEPDLYGNRLRPDQKWDFSTYYAQWLTFAQEIRKRLPYVPLGGPDTAEVNGVDWVLPFAKRAKNYVQLLTGHYYAEGPPRSPQTNMAKLLRSDQSNHRLKAEIEEDIEASSVANTKVPFRMTEANSCYWGGKPGLSDAFGSALWGGDFMLKVTFAGYSGVNFQGGTSGAISAALGTPLANQTLAGKQAKIDRLSSTYTPIAGIAETGFYARPLYYGMLIAGHLAGGAMLESRLDRNDVNLTAYASSVEGQIRTVIFNKDLNRSAVLRIKVEKKTGRATIWSLTAQAVDSKHGVTLAGTEVTGDGHWSPQTENTVNIRSGEFFLHLPATSAALLFI